MSSPTASSGPAGSAPVLPDEGDFYQVLFRGSFDAMVLSENGVFVDINEPALKIFGVAREELIGTNLMRFIAPEMQATVAANLANQREAAYELRLLRPDGSQFDAEIDPGKDRRRRQSQAAGYRRARRHRAPPER